MPLPQRMLTLDDVAEILNVSYSQVYAIVRREELRAGKIGGKGIWRVAPGDLEAYIDGCYEETHRWIVANPFVEK